MSSTTERIGDLTKRINILLGVKSVVEAKFSTTATTAEQHEVMDCIQRLEDELYKQRDQAILYRDAELIAEKNDFGKKNVEFLEAMCFVINIYRNKHPKRGDNA